MMAKEFFKLRYAQVPGMSAVRVYNWYRLGRVPRQQIVQTSTTLDANRLATIDKLAAEKGLSRSEAIRRIFDFYALSKHGSVKARGAGEEALWGSVSREGTVDSPPCARTAKREALA